MIIIAEPNKDIKKRLCDLLSKERVIGVTTIADSLETLCKFRNNIDVIIVNIAMLKEILSNQMLHRLCQKLGLKEPPILGYFTNGQKELKNILEKSHANITLIEYSDHYAGFPDRYISALKKLYPAVNVDIEKTKEVWGKQEAQQEFVDIRKWLEEEGFAEAIEKKELQEEVKRVEETLASSEEKPVRPEENYKKLYFELKNKYDELLSYVKELIDSVKNPDL